MSHVKPYEMFSVQSFIQTDHKPMRSWPLGSLGHLPRVTTLRSLEPLDKHSNAVTNASMFRFKNEEHMSHEASSTV